MITTENIFNISKDWKLFLESELSKPYFNILTDFVIKEYIENICYPPKDQIFDALNSCPLDDIKVIILGQDPYHRFNQSNGLAFSVNSDIKLPPSLKNIFKEISNNYDNKERKNGNLLSWSKQGVLLLNSVLTVRQGMPNSHSGKGWEKLTDFIIHNLSKRRSNLVFLLWGSYAQRKDKLINQQKHIILRSGHPSPLSANRGLWFGNRHFIKTNQYLKSNKKTTINWFK